MKRRSTAIIAVINIIIVFAVLPVFVSSAAGYYPSATPEFFVNDFAEVLSSDTRENIVLIGKSLEDLTTAQVVVVTVDTLGAYDIDSYANELFRQWGIGQKEEQRSADPECSAGKAASDRSRLWA